MFWSAALVLNRVERVPLRFLVVLAVLGTTLVPAQVYSYFYALSVLPASTASVIVNTSPVHVAWMERLALGEQFARGDLLILGAIVAGAILVGGATPHAGHTFGFVVLGAATLASASYRYGVRLACFVGGGWLREVDHHPFRFVYIDI